MDTKTLFLEHIRSDGARVVELAQRSPDAAVPTCPQWKAADLLLHVGMVHRNKAHQVSEAMLEPCPVIEQPSPEEDRYEWYRTGLQTLLAALDEAGEAPVWSWQPFQWTASFWTRRMAHETAIHRVDAELVAGERSSVPPALAIDGVDEVFDVWLAHRPRLAGYRGTGESVCVSVHDASWLVTFHPSKVELQRFGDPGSELLESEAVGFRNGAAPPPADARVTGEPDAVYLWLWGRLGDDAVTIAGDCRGASALRHQIASIT